MTDHEFITMRLRENQRQHRPAAANGRLHRADRRSGMNKLWIVAAAVALIGALIAGCGGSGDTPADGGSGTLPSATASDARAAETRLNDCEYARALGRSLGRFTAAVPAFGTASITDKDGVVRALDAFDGELAALISELRSYQLSADIARVNDGVAQVFADARAQLPAVRSAVASGDVARLTAAATTLTTEVFPELDRVQAENKAAIERLDKCASTHAR
jgi:hypothetical protein